MCGSLQCVKRQTSKYIDTYTSMSNRYKFQGETKKKKLRHENYDNLNLNFLWKQNK